MPGPSDLYLYAGKNHGRILIDCPYIPMNISFLLMCHLTNTPREFLGFKLKAELIRFRWSGMKGTCNVNVTGIGISSNLNRVEKIWGCNLRIHRQIFFPVACIFQALYNSPPCSLFLLILNFRLWLLHHVLH